MTAEREEMNPRPEDLARLPVGTYGADDAAVEDALRDQFPDAEVATLIAQAKEP
jgi:hypothetical protein